MLTISQIHFFISLAVPLCPV